MIGDGILPKQCGSDLCVLYVRTIDDTCLLDIVGLICVCILFLFRIQNMKMIDGKPEYTGAFVRQFFTSLCLHVCWFLFCLSVVILIIIIHVAILAEWLILMELARSNTQKSRLRGLQSGWSDHCGLQMRLSLIQVVSN